MTPTRASQRYRWIALSLFVTLSGGCAAEQGEETAGPAGASGDGGTGAGPSGAGGTGTGSGGAGGGGPTCGVAPCGGDVSGAWTYADPCSTAAWTEESCGSIAPDLKQRSRYTSYPKGTATFDASGIVTITKSVVAGWEFVIPKACLFSFSECVDAVQGDGVVCNQEGTDCLCTSLAESPVETSVEPYVASETKLVVGSGAEEATLLYCITGDTLQLAHPETNEVTYLFRN
jgi:hypothetical protein